MTDTAPFAPTLELSGTNVTGVQIPQIGLGTWPMTGAECTDAVTLAISNGYRHIDTAQNYGNEDAVGAAVKATSVPREELFITSKFNAEHHGDLEHVRAGVQQRLDVMQLDYLDLVLIHWPNPEQGKYLQTAQALAELMDTGMFRAWGVSNFNVRLMDELTQAGLTVPINQIQVDPLAQAVANRAANDQAGTLTSAYSPVGRNIDLTAYPALTEPAERLGRTAHQIVLRWHMQQGRVAIPKSADATRQRQNLDVFSFELTDQEMAAIDALDTGEGQRLDPENFGH